MKTYRVTLLGATRAVTAVAVGALGLSACATIIHSPRQQVGISSIPSGATVTIDDMDSGKTPLVTKLSRKQEHVLRIEMAGYKPFEATLKRKVSGWIWGNLVFGGIVGLVIDVSSGGMYELTPDQISATLASGQASIKAQGDGLYVAAVLEPRSDWVKVAQLQRN